MTTQDLAKLVREMRCAQRCYFRTRVQGYLRESKRLESEVDSAIDEILGEEADPQPRLFTDRSY